jgi:hypothetical protein
LTENTAIWQVLYRAKVYLFPMLDMPDVFASPRWRTLGTQAENFLLAPPGWTGTVSRLAK